MNLRSLCFVTLAGLSMLAGNGCGGSGKANRADAPTLTDAPSLPDTLTDLGTGGGGVAGTSGRGGTGSGGVGGEVAAGGRGGGGLGGGRAGGGSGAGGAFGAAGRAGSGGAAVAGAGGGDGGGHGGGVAGSASGGGSAGAAGGGQAGRGGVTGAAGAGAAGAGGRGGGVAGAAGAGAAGAGGHGGGVAGAAGGGAGGQGGHGGGVAGAAGGGAGGQGGGLLPCPPSVPTPLTPCQEGTTDPDTCYYADCNGAGLTISSCYSYGWQNTTTPCGVSSCAGIMNCAPGTFCHELRGSGSSVSCDPYPAACGSGPITCECLREPNDPPCCPPHNAANPRCCSAMLQLLICVACIVPDPGCY